MATTFVFSPVPRFYQLAAKAHLSAFAQHLHDFAMREELPWFVSDRSSLRSEDQSTRIAIEPPSSPFQAAFLDLFSSWIPSTNSQRLYTASLCCSNDEVIDNSKAAKYTRSAGPIAPPKDHPISPHNPAVTTSANKIAVPASNPTISGQGCKLGTNSKDDCSDWLNLTSYKRPLTISNSPSDSEIVPRDRIIPPPGSKSRLAKILNKGSRI